MQLNALAKINWTLQVTGVRPDGYHLLDMLMQPISLCDTVTLQPSRELRLQVEGAPQLSAGTDNLAYRAAAALRDAAHCSAGAEITLVKRIPSGAGLGGGSADAAAVLKGLNQLWSLNLSEEALEAIGLRLGADVPFCLRGGLCRVQGIGEQLTPLGKGPVWPLVVVQPCEGLSTAEIFRAWRPGGAAPLTEATQQALLHGDLSALPPRPGNQLQDISLPRRPAIGDAVEALLRESACCAQMSGSGSAVFGVFPERALAERAAAQLTGRYGWDRCFVCETAA